MPYGLKDIELAKLNEVFAANERIERVVLYGSRAKGNYKPFSDVDIALEGAELTHNDLTSPSTTCCCPTSSTFPSFTP